MKFLTNVEFTEDVKLTNRKNTQFSVFSLIERLEEIEERLKRIERKIGLISEV